MPRVSAAQKPTEEPPVYTIREVVPANLVLKAMLWKGLEFNSYQTLLMYRKQQQADGTCVLNVPYRESSCGRLVCSHGFQLLQRAVRSILLSGSQWRDVDIENCHPNLLLRLAKEHGLDCDLLEHYCLNTESERRLHPNLKRDVLVAINDPDIDSTVPLLRQCKQIVKLLYCEHRYTAFRPDGGCNQIGRFISKLLCSKERELLVSIYQRFDAQDVMALIHDGLIVRWHQKSFEAFMECNKEIAPMRLVFKPWPDVPESQFYDLRDFDYDNRVYFNHLSTLTDREFSSVEEWMFSVRPVVLETVRIIGARDIIVKEGPMSYSVLPKVKLDMTFHIKGAEGKKGTTQNFKGLIASFAPLISFSRYTVYRSESPMEFSVFCGFAARGEAPENYERLVSPILRHIKEVWASDNEEMFQYIIRWLAFIVQNFPKKTGKNIILNGDEGTGKSIVMEWFKEEVFGHNLCYTTSGSEMLTRGFNAHLAGRILVCLEELKGDNDNQWKHAIDVIKHLTTSKTMNIERKGVDVREETNGMNIIAFTNYEHALPNVPGMNRRLVMNRVSDRYKGNKEYFSGLKRALDHPQSGVSMLHYLRSVETSYEALEQIPQTLKKVEMRWHYLQWYEKMAYLMIAQSAIKGGVPESYEFTSPEAQSVISAYDIYTPFAKVAKTEHGRNIAIGQHLSKRFEKHRTSGNITRYRFKAEEYADQAMLEQATAAITASQEVYDDCQLE